MMSSFSGSSVNQRTVAARKCEVLQCLQALYRSKGAKGCTENLLSLKCRRMPGWRINACIRVTFEQSGIVRVDVSDGSSQICSTSQVSTHHQVSRGIKKHESQRIDPARLTSILLRCNACQVILAQASFNKSEPIHILPFFACTLMHPSDRRALMNHKKCTPQVSSIPKPTAKVARNLKTFVVYSTLATMSGSIAVELELAPLCAPHTPLQSRLLQRMLEESVLPDVVLRVGRLELRAHRAVLAASSPVFRGMFQHEGFSESQLGEVAIEGVRPEVMEAALGFLYGRQQHVAADTDTLVELLVLAERYQLPELKAECEGLLAYDWSVDLLKLLALADTHNAAILKSVVMKRISQHPDRKELLGTPAAREFIASHPNVIGELFSMI